MAEHTSSPTLGSRPGSDTTSNRQNTSGSAGIVDRVKEQATSQLTSQKDRATDGLGSVASAVRQTTQTLRDQKHDTVAGYVEQAADQIERLSERLKNKDVSELLDDAQQLARRQPALFVGGAFALGLVGARFLKSSSSRDDADYRSGGSYGAYGSTSGSYGTGSNRTVGTRGSSGDVTGGTGAGYSGSGYGTSSRGTSTSSTPSSTTSGSTAGSTVRRDDSERF